MEAILHKEGTSLTASVSGRLDTVSSPELEQKLAGELDGVTQLILDFSDLEYISSSGLRVLLQAKKGVNGGKVKVINANSDIMDVFEITGFDQILDIE